ncbi:2'-5' RNA ligase family protein [Alteraurantiacibacter palmitatis]|uniref:2'-5' RNA ligase family protein n=1 Tax=Alteraurantiacibacter palmitatis TaxID=2054628 RepID=A0ABV7E7C5_9SPHN
MTHPLVVTAMLPPDLYSWATQLRAENYPAERNVLKAHVTLFHALPPFVEGEAREVLARLAARTAPVPARLEGVMNLGGGTALRLSSPLLLTLREEIADRFTGLLTGQDSHAVRLHITVQNKVVNAEAKGLQQWLAARVEPQDFTFRGLELHRYLGGPWEPLGKWPFRGRPAGR